MMKYFKQFRIENIIISTEEFTEFVLIFKMIVPRRVHACVKYSHYLHIMVTFSMNFTPLPIARHVYCSHSRHSYTFFISFIHYSELLLEQKE